MAHPQLAARRNRTEGQEAAMNAGFGGLNGVLQGYLFKALTPGAKSRMGILGAGGALAGAGGSVIADKLLGEKERGNAAHDALQGALTGGAVTSLAAGAAPGGETLLKYLMATKGISKAKAIAMLLGGAGLGGAAAGAGLGALGAGVNNLYGDEK